MVKAYDLLARGYFPKEVPSAFSTDDFADKIWALTAKVPAAWTAPALLNLARPGTLRRRLGIPNPFAQRVLVDRCVKNWAKFDAHVGASSISMSRPIPVARGRALDFTKEFGSRPAQRSARMTRARFTLKADISEFYGSIYTHSLEWALNGKEEAKANLALGKKKKKSLLGSELDVAVRNGQQGQTKGIPIGPDTSLLLAELILASIDNILTSQVQSVATAGLRLMDDFEFFARSRAEAEDALFAWDSLLNSYELSLNPAKTFIVEGLLPPEAPWRSTLSQMRLRSSDRQLTNDLHSLFSIATELARANPENAVLSYAIQRARSANFGTASWNTFSDLLLAAATAEPSCLRYVSRLFATAESDGRSLDRDKIAETMNEICEYHSRFEHGSEVSWALYVLIDLGLDLSEAAAKQVVRMQDNCCLLMLWHLAEQGMITGAAPDFTSVATRAEHPLVGKSEDWLLGYEAARRKWVDPVHFESEAHWKEMLDVDVAFFNPPMPGASVAPTATPDTSDVSIGADDY